ncbi:hypothetical protein, partial [Gordonia soli]|uniref:hypothetical protein n=1 Tax=Gordonia soli TaxID=320799 RepID=UPI001C3F378C
AEFIAWAREGVPQLLADLDRAEDRTVRDSDLIAETWRVLGGDPSGSCLDSARRVVAERDAARATLQQVREQHTTVLLCMNPSHNNPDAVCPECVEYCAACDQQMPCTTVRILDGGGQQ